MLLDKRMQGVMRSDYADGEDSILLLTWMVFLSKNIAEKTLEIPWKPVIKDEGGKLLK